MIRSDLFEGDPFCIQVAIMVMECHSKTFRSKYVETDWRCVSRDVSSGRNKGPFCPQEKRHNVIMSITSVLRRRWLIVGGMRFIAVVVVRR